jgi:hypothetical protein
MADPIDTAMVAIIFFILVVVILGAIAFVIVLFI